MNNLTIAAAYGYEHEDVRAFLQSLRERFENFHLVLLVTPECPLNRVVELQDDERIEL